MEIEEEDFIFYGTPVEREEEIASRKKKAIAEASGNMRTLPAWKQEVRDEEGRRRFHGAFTGGFSAGYYNTVGSKEGWTPQSFTSSRKNRAGARKQSISDFLDEDEKAELEGQSLAASSQFDTFGFTAAEYARREAEKEQHQRPSAIPGPVPEELVPASESIGVKLLLKMGWRHGRSIKDLRASSDARRVARKAFLAFSTGDKMKETADSAPPRSELETPAEPLDNDDIQFCESTPVYVLNPKQDLYGLGYDPFKHAPEFRERKRSRVSASKGLGYRKPLTMKESLLGSKSGKVAPGFGIGALEELDVEDDDIYAGYDFEETYVEDEEPSGPIVDNKPRLTSKDHDVLPGFRVAAISDCSMERFDPPEIPKGFSTRHKFPGALRIGPKISVSAPPDVPPPEDNNLKVLIEGVAALVSRSGKLFEDLSREKNQSNPLFDFLRGGNGHDYYERRLWEEQQKRSDHNKLPLDGKSSQSMQKMTAETRGRLLGERPLERSSKDAAASASSGGSIQFPANLSDTFTKPGSSQEALEVVKPFKDDPSKQERFEQFLKEKYQGGLRATDSGRINSMSEAARARERLDFEAAAEALEKGKLYKEVKPTVEQPVDFLAGGLQFTSGGTEQSIDAKIGDAKSKMYPKREEFQWRPAPLLCKRYDLIDPYMGKPPPTLRSRSKMDSLIFLPDSVKAGSELQESLSAHQKSNAKEPKKDLSAKESEVEVQVENVERPVDLYKAIFSDESEDEEEETSTKRPEDQEKKNQAAATTLNRLMAGDFLESLGKELGLEVPPDAIYQEMKPLQKEVIKAKPMEEDNKSSKGKVEEGFSQNGSNSKPQLEKVAQEEKNELAFGFKQSTPEDEKSWKKREELPNRSQQSESSEEERRRKHSKRHKRRISDSDSDLSNDYRDRHGSRSKEKREESPRGKSRNQKKYSKHHKHHQSKKSSSRYSTDTDEEWEESRKDRRRRRH